MGTLICGARMGLKRTYPGTTGLPERGMPVDIIAGRGFDGRGFRFLDTPSSLLYIGAGHHDRFVLAGLCEQAAHGRTEESKGSSTGSPGGGQEGKCRTWYNW